MPPDQGTRGGGAIFDTTALVKSVFDAVEVGINQALDKAHESAVEDAPVRAVFKKGSWRRRRGSRARGFTLDEANSEDAIRRRLNLKPAEANAFRTAGRQAGPSVNNPYLRRASVRQGNPNSFAPFVLQQRVVLSDADRRFVAKLKREAAARKEPLPPGFEDEVPEIRGGRELGPRGGMLHRPAKRQLDARGRYELRTGRANFTDAETGVTTLGGTLRKSIKKVGPQRYMNTIRGAVVSPVRYSKFQEFGTRHNRATPYMRPAILKLTTSYRPMIVKAINRISFKTGRRR